MGARTRRFEIAGDSFIVHVNWDLQDTGVPTADQLGLGIRATSLRVPR